MTAVPLVGITLTKPNTPPLVMGTSFVSGLNTFALLFAATV